MLRFIILLLIDFLICVIPIDETLANNNSIGWPLPNILGMVPSHSM